MQSQLLWEKQVAEGEGFEPPVPFQVQRFSSSLLQRATTQSQSLTVAYHDVNARKVTSVVSYRTLLRTLAQGFRTATSSKPDQLRTNNPLKILA